MGDAPAFRYDRAVLCASFALFGYLVLLPEVMERLDLAKREHDEAVGDAEDRDDSSPTTSTKLGYLKGRRWELGVCGELSRYGVVSQQQVREWLEVLLVSGVGHVWFYEPSDVEILQTLRDYEERGFLTLLPSLEQLGTHPGCIGAPSESECTTPKICQEQLSPHTTHWMHLESDEIVYPTTECNLMSAFKNRCTATDAYHWVRWERYGTGSHQELPKGLLSENFLSSGGDCALHNTDSVQCKKHPFEPCANCVKTKVVYNTMCIGAQHVGAFNEPVNTTTWKKNVRGSIDGAAALVEKGDKSKFLSSQCTETPLEKDAFDCKAHKRRCCSAGIRVAKFTGAIPNLTAYLKKQPQDDFEGLDLNMALSPGLLRFVRGLRQRFTLQGYPVADSTVFIDYNVNLSVTSDRSCFMERGWRYTVSPKDKHTTIIESDDAATPKECCKECWLTNEADGRCHGWSFSTTDLRCTLVYSTTGTVTAMRTMDSNYVSGIRLQHGECPVPSDLPILDSTIEVERPATPEPLPPVLADEDQPETSTKHSLLRVGQHHWTLGACGSTAVSSEWLREWIEVLLLGGVDHIWLLNDNKPEQDPMTQEILLEYESKGYVTIIPIRHPKSHPGCKGMWIESDCITPKVCHEYVAPYVDWWTFIDTDEFMFPTMGCDLGDHMNNYCDSNKAYHELRWERFGTSGHYDMPGGLMTENFLSSGGDCTAHTANGMECTKTWTYCMECRHTKVLYQTKCIGEEHVGWVHEPVNTSYWKLEHKNKFFLPKQSGFTSVYKHPKCFDEPFEEATTRCRNWGEKGGGAQYPPVPSSDCCAAGFGYNHYGTKSMSKWLEKKRSVQRRGFLPTNFEVIEQNTTISSGILRFARALRQRYDTLGLPVSKNVSFIDFTNAATAEIQTCFVEKNWVYKPNAELGTKWITSNATDTSKCCRACWEYTAPDGRCGGWSFEKKTKQCNLVHSTYNSWKEGYDLGVRRWPHSAFTAQRLMDVKYVSGIPLYDGECPVPDRLLPKK